MLTTLVFAIIVFVLIWALIGMLPGAPSLDARLPNVLRIILILVAILWVIKFSGIFGHL